MLDLFDQRQNAEAFQNAEMGREITKKIIFCFFFLQNVSSLLHAGYVCTSLQTWQAKHTNTKTETMPLSLFSSNITIQLVSTTSELEMVGLSHFPNYAPHRLSAWFVLFLSVPSTINTIVIILVSQVQLKVSNGPFNIQKKLFKLASHCVPSAGHGTRQWDSFYQIIRG